MLLPFISIPVEVLSSSSLGKIENENVIVKAVSMVHFEAFQYERLIKILVSSSKSMVKRQYKTSVDLAEYALSTISTEPFLRMGQIFSNVKFI